MLLSFAGAASAQESSRAPKDPYQKLFQQPRLEQSAVQQKLQAALRDAEATHQRPRVVCGMTLLPANPKVDPKMAIEPRRDDTRYTIRAIEPQTCWIPESERK